MADAMEQDLVQPRATVCAGFETLKRAPRLKVHFLDHVFCLPALCRQAERTPEQIVEMRHRLRFKPFLRGSVARQGSDRVRRIPGRPVQEWWRGLSGPTRHCLCSFHIYKGHDRGVYSGLNSAVADSLHNAQIEKRGRGLL